jgi:hypothetical protein
MQGKEMEEIGQVPSMDEYVEALVSLPQLAAIVESIDAYPAGAAMRTTADRIASREALREAVFEGRCRLVEQYRPNILGKRWIPTTDPELGVTAANWRNGKYTLTKEMESRLESLGFVWSYDEYIYPMRFEQIRILQTMGVNVVSLRYLPEADIFPGLARWVPRILQPETWKKLPISERQTLEKLGVVAGSGKGNKKWDERFALFVEEGDLSLTKTGLKAGDQLFEIALWANDQRQAFVNPRYVKENESWGKYNSKERQRRWEKLKGIGFFDTAHFREYKRTYQTRKRN